MTRIEKIVILVAATLCACVAGAQAEPHYLVVNNNHPEGNFATFFTLAKDGTFIAQKRVATGGTGNFGGSTPGVAVFHSAMEDCAFVADAGTSDIAAINSSLEVVGRFHGGFLDRNNFAGIALTVNRGFLYSAFIGKATVRAVAGLEAFRFCPAVG